MPYAIMSGYSTSTSFAIKIYEVKRFKEVDYRDDSYEFKVIRPVFGRYWNLKPRQTCSAFKKHTANTLEKIKFITKKLIIEKIFLRDNIPKLDQLIRQMNKAK